EGSFRAPQYRGLSGSGGRNRLDRWQEQTADGRMNHKLCFLPPAVCGLVVMEQRLQKLIAEAGIASRRHAEELIASGEVTVNGQVITEPGTKADPGKDHIKVRGKLINPLLAKREKVHILLNKPKGYLSSASDPEGRPLVTELLPA